MFLLFIDLVIILLWVSYVFVFNFLFGSHLKQIILSLVLFLIYFFWEEVYALILFFIFLITEILSPVGDKVTLYLFLFFIFDWFLKYLFDDMQEEDSSLIGDSI